MNVLDFLIGMVFGSFLLLVIVMCIFFTCFFLKEMWEACNKPKRKRHGRVSDD